MSQRSVIDRFMSKVDRQPEGCWLWTASCGTSGYGQFHLDGTTVVAHRVAYELLVGPVPLGRQIDHLCRTRHCVNPKHLEPVTQKENILRGVAPTAVNAVKTHCVHGHELSGANLYVRLDRPGRRQCRECSRIAKRVKA